VSGWFRAHGTTAAAVALATLLTVPYVSLVVDLVREVADPRRIADDDFRAMLQLGMDAGSDEASTGSLIGAVVLGTVCMVAIVIVAGIALRRSWAREAGMLVFGVIALVATSLSLGGLLSSPPAPGAGRGLLSGLGAATVVALLFARPTQRTFDAAAARREAIRRRRSAPR
jgi:hypothetical protein